MVVSLEDDRITGLVRDDLSVGIEGLAVAIDERTAIKFAVGAIPPCSRVGARDHPRSAETGVGTIAGADFDGPVGLDFVEEGRTWCRLVGELPSDADLAGFVDVRLGQIEVGTIGSVFSFREAPLECMENGCRKENRKKVRIRIIIDD